MPAKTNPTSKSENISEGTTRPASKEDLLIALEESVKLQSHYAGLLNNYDGGKRIEFKTPEAWIARLRTTKTLPLEAHGLAYWLDNISVAEVDEHHVEANKDISGKDLSGLIGWFYVANEIGVCAYFGKEEDAFRFRLAEINRRLNG